MAMPCVSVCSAEIRLILLYDCSHPSIPAFSATAGTTTFYNTGNWLPPGTISLGRGIFHFPDKDRTPPAYRYEEKINLAVAQGKPNASLLLQGRCSFGSRAARYATCNMGWNSSEGPQLSAGAV